MRTRSSLLPLSLFTSLVTSLVMSLASCSGGASQPAAPAPVVETPPAVAPPAPLDNSAEMKAVIAKAVAAPSRPAADIARDADRKPADVLAFFGVEPGMVVVDLISGGGYYTDLLSRVVGTDGTVYAHNNEFVQKFAAEPLSKRLENKELGNVKRWDRELDALGFENGSLDGALMVLFYHDTIWQGTDRAVMNKGLFAALKPGGFFGVVDHVAAADAGDVSKTLHRMDPSVIVSEVTAAGFVLEAESDVLRHAEDDHTVNVFDDAIRGKTDRVVYLFRKPAN